MNILLSLKSKNKKSLYLYLCYFYTFINRQLKDNYTLKILAINSNVLYSVSLNRLDTRFNVAYDYTFIDLPLSLMLLIQYFEYIGH